MDSSVPATPSVLTLGHSNRCRDDFLDLIDGCSVHVLFDVRRYPSSRRNPQFNRGNLADDLPERDVRYVHREVLGGFRSPREGSPNTGWRSEGFQGYADHAQTDAFQQALGEIVEAHERLRDEAEGHVGVMCAEKVPERCHRRIISDWLAAREIPVHHVIDPTTVRKHEMTEFARVEERRVTYPGLV